MTGEIKAHPVSKRSRDFSWLFTVVGSAIVVGGVVWFSDSGRRHNLFHSFGEGGETYRECHRKIESEFENFKLREVERHDSEQEHVFKFRLDIVHPDNSPGGEAVRMCRGRSGSVTID